MDSVRSPRIEPTTWRDQRDALFETTLNGKSAFVRRIGELELHARWRIRQDERLANFEILNHERLPLEQLHTGFKRHLNKCRGRKNDMVFNLVIFQKSHVARVQPNDPGRHRAWQPDIKQAASTRCEAAVASIACFVPPTGLFPSVSRQREEMPGRRHRGKIERNAGAVQIHCSLEHGFKFALAAGRGDHGALWLRAP